MRKLICLLILASVAAPAAAVSTSHWTQSNADDFNDGKLHDVVVTNLGDVKLSRAVKTLLEEDPRISMVTALAQTPDGTIYAGTAPQGVLLKISGGKVTTAATIDDAVSVTALLPESDGALLVGVTGAKGRVLRIDRPGDKPREIFSAKDVQYVWGLARSDDGTVYAATGPNGQLFAIHPDGKQEEIYKSDENNLTALVSDGKGNLYLGTDPDGLVVRLNIKTRDAFVVYNTDEEEITALALDDQGNLYAATGQAMPAEQPGTTEPAREETDGRPEPAATVPLPSKPPTPAKPPAPTPNPGEPAPIPQQHKAYWPQQRRSDVMPILLVSRSDDDPGPPDVPGIPAAPDEPAAPPDNAAAADDTGKSDQANPKTPADQTQAQGNAIYKIDPDGFVTEVFRQQVVIYSMIASKGVLLVGTGDDGEIYQVDPAAEETVIIAKTQAKQVTALLAAADGQVYVGLSNTGGIASMTDGYAQTGTYTSPVLDATQVSRFGVIEMHGSLPRGTTLTVATRAGNVKDDEAQGWSPWTAEASAQEFLHIDSAPARFLQYRITFSTTDPAQTPIINDVDVAYQMPHLAPVIKSIKIMDAQDAAAAAAGGGAAAPPAAPGGKPADSPKPLGTGPQTITWDASSPDDDTLIYTLYFRSAPAGPWIMLKDKLTDPTYTWDTKTAADGRYQVKVVASDALANPVGDGKTASRVSDVLVVDNTAPVIGDLKTAVTGRSAKFDLRVTDGAGTIASMDYSVDSSQDWQAVLPVDKIFDQPEETVSFSVDDLSPGEHQITLRATDSAGNVGMQTVTVTVGRK